MKQRLDRALVERNLTSTRSQAESYIKLGFVSVDNKIVNQPSHMVDDKNNLSINLENQYVSRAGLKLASVADSLDLDFKEKTVLDVGSSTGGFTDYALRHLAKRVIAVDVGKDQLHPSLRTNKSIELYEQTDIRDVSDLSSPIDLVLIDVSFISLRSILPKIHQLSNKNTNIVAMFKPQFEAGSSAKHKGVIKNEKIRRQILFDFESWLKQNHFLIVKQADSKIQGSKGNKERFYLLRKERFTANLMLLLSENINIPGEPEPLGAITSDNTMTYNSMYSIGEIEEFNMDYYPYIEMERMNLLHRLHLLLGKHGEIKKDRLRHHNVILVSDGLNNGFSISIAVNYIKTISYKKLIVVSPFATPEAYDKMRLIAD